MRLRRSEDGTFLALEVDGTGYVLMVRAPGSDPIPLICCGVLGTGDGLRSSARHNAVSGRWSTVEIWQAAAGTWSEPELLLESYALDGTCVVHNAPRPPATAS